MGLSSPYALVADAAFGITPSDTVSFAPLTGGLSRDAAIFVGGTGVVTLVDSMGNVQAFTIAAVPFVIPIRATRVNSTGTTATLLVGMY